MDKEQQHRSWMWLCTNRGRYRPPLHFYSSKSVIFASPLPKARITSLAVVSVIRDLIIDGIDGSQALTPEAGERIVLEALISARNTPSVIKAVFANPKWRIGERYRAAVARDGEDVVDRQLAMQIFQIWRSEPPCGYSISVVGGAGANTSESKATAEIDVVPQAIPSMGSGKADLGDR